MFVKTLGDFANQEKHLIEKVIFLLHPTYKRPLLTLTKAPFQATRKAYGSFDIAVTIHFKRWLKMEPMNLEHMLVFEKEGSKSVFSIMVKKSLLPPELKAIANRTIKNDVQEIIRKR